MEEQKEKKLFWAITKLREWEKNPRDIKLEELEKLKQKIVRWGQFKPILITPDGEVIGGNMRYRAMRELGTKEVWVSVVNPKDEAEKLEIALTDNEMSGYYLADELAVLLQGLDIDKELYRVSIQEGKTLNEILDLFKPEDMEPTQQDEQTTPEVLIEINTNQNTFDKIKPVLDEWAQKYGIEYNIS